ncbi:hypothetical protein GPECTOR_59g629 [Gonium pectorale]|uniref:N-acetyltransferase domain-containing protein n=1 Tax=Gonium pectorale TaxID=33097 RepID=A0A150G595_GONPE|nr:hypothetical protein GPECTOR_59g629 [Gonium pectorale]|eukprot:KXZ45022.1 hypothetical protein GPECTOR_59g629 [Gonium pectorale]
MSKCLTSRQHTGGRVPGRARPPTRATRCVARPASAKQQFQLAQIPCTDAAAQLRAAECFGRALVGDPILNWITEGQRPQAVVRFFTRAALMALRALDDHSHCWQLLPPVEAAAGGGGGGAPEAAAGALVGDPILNWLTEGQRPQAVVRFFTGAALMALRALDDHSHCWQLLPPVVAVAGGGGGGAPEAAAVCICCEYPRDRPSELRLLAAGLLPALGALLPDLRSVGHMLATFGEMDDGKEAFHQAYGPFLYIACFGTDPAQQGRGLGSQLMGKLVAASEERGIPLYLEANSPGGQRFYERHGFQTLGEIRAKPQAPPLFVMARFPSSGKQARP